MDSINERLIEAVQRRQALYDKTEDNYSNRMYINQQWKEIGEELGIDENAARKKWTTLRDYFYKSHKKLNTIKSEREKKRKWYLYDTMTFLLPHIITDRKSSLLNISEPSDVEDDAFSQVSEASALSSELNFSLPHEFKPASSEGGDPQTSCLGTVSRSVTNNTCVRVVPTPNRKRVRYSYLQEEAKDDCDYFLQSLAPQLRMMDPMARFECQAEIQMLILRHLRLNQSSKKIEPVTTEDQHHCSHIHK